MDDGRRRTRRRRAECNDVVLVQLEILPTSALRALIVGSDMGACTILNPAPSPRGWVMDDEWYSQIDILIPNESELSDIYLGRDDAANRRTDIVDDITGEGEEMMARALLARGVRRAVIVTLGPRGAMIVMKDDSPSSSSSSFPYDDDGVVVDGEYGTRTIMISEPIDLPCKSDPVVDAVGAGDAFCGSLAAYLSGGMTLERAASMACGFASMSVRKRGAQESYPRAEDLPDCLRIEGANAHTTTTTTTTTTTEDDGGTVSEYAEIRTTTTTTTDDNDGIISGDTEIRTTTTTTTTRKRITFVTGNKNKLVEVRRLLTTGSSDDDDERSSPLLAYDIDDARLDLPEFQGTPRDIAIEKCRMASRSLGTAVITEDTSLCFRGLNDLPGPYIKWFLDGLGHDGLYKLLTGCGDYRAYAQTIVAYAPGPDMDVLLFEGTTEGRIVPPRGERTFGWDPIFEPTEDEQGIGRSRTYAEMTLDEKNAISHRGRAFRNLREFLLCEIR